MEVYYRRDLNHNYMILENEKITGNEYGIRMMEQNHIPELLPLQLRKMNGKVFLYYEITSRQPLAQLYDTTSMKSRDIEQLLEGIKNGMEHAHQFLLSSDDFLLEPEFIYLNLGTGQVQLCCVPLLERTEKNSFLTLAEFILKKLDHGDRRAVDLGYELFARVSQENFSFQECVKEMLKEKRSYWQEEAVSEGNDSYSGSFEEELFEIEENEEERRAGRRNRKGRDIQGEKVKEWDLKERGVKGREAKDKDTKSRRIKNRSEKDSGVKGKNGKRKVISRRTAENGLEKVKVNKSVGKQVLLGMVVVLLLLLFFGAIVYFGRLDLTQTGGLAFLFLAVLWITYCVIQGRKQEKKKYWLEEEQEEEEWMEALLGDIYDREGERGDDGWQSAQRKGTEDDGWQNGQRRRREVDWRDVDGKRRSESGRSREEESPIEGCGETRCLTEAEYEPPLRLFSQLRSQYPDLELDKERMVIGKKRDQVDLWLKQDCISRIHARVERQAEGYFLTDLNSMNGTFVNGERLRPNERRQIRAGDRVSFASLRYVVKQF